MKEKIRTNTRRHNRLCARLLVIAMSLFIVLSFWCERSMTVSADTWEAYGDNVNYYFSQSSGTLTIYGEGAMKDCSGNYQAPWSSLGNEIKTVKIESGITSIGNHAFESCFGLTSIEIPNSVESIGDQAFAFCGALESVTIPGSVKSIGDQAFFYCGALESVTISEGVESIGDQAFSSCDVLESVEIPGSVKSIGDQAFAYCRVLESVTISEGVESIGDKAFYNCDVLESVEIPGSVESIGDSAFYLCSSLTSVTIPGSVKSIGDQAFAFCRALESVTISEGVESIGQYAFYYCDVLESVTIPDSVRSIGASAFANCSSLTSITIPDTVTSIGTDAIPSTASQIKYEVDADGRVSITAITPANDQSKVAIPETINGYTVVSVASDYQQYVSSTGHTHYAAGKATCTEEAICAICGVTLDSARGHAYDYNNPTFKWAEDYSSCKLEFTCTHDNSHTETYECTVSSKITVAATCEEDGEKKYTASVTIEGESYRDTQTEVIEKQGHEYGEPEFTWAEDYTCTAEFTCTRDGYIETVECAVSSEITKDATANTEGERTYTATAQVDGVTYTATKTEAVAKLPAAGSSSGEQNSANGGSTNSSSVNSGSSEWATTETLYTDADNRSMRRLVNGSLEIVGDSGVLAQGTKIKATLLSSGDEFERAAQAVSSRLSGVSAYKVYDIGMMTSAGVEIHELNGYVSVTLPIPEGLTVGDGKGVMVYRLEADGTLTRCDTTIAEGKITFLTNHFSTYVFAEYSVVSGVPETSDSNAGVMFTALFLLGCVAVAYVFSKKRKFFRKKLRLK